MKPNRNSAEFNISIGAAITSRYLHNSSAGVYRRIEASFEQVGVQNFLRNFDNYPVRIDATQQVMVCAEKKNPGVVYLGTNGTVVSSATSIQRNLVISPDKNAAYLDMAAKILGELRHALPVWFGKDIELVISGHSQGAGIAGFMGQLFGNEFPVRACYMLGGPRIWTRKYEAASVTLSRLTADDRIKSYGHIDDLVVFLGHAEYEFPSCQWFFSDTNAGPLAFDPAWPGNIAAIKLIQKSKILTGKLPQTFLARMIRDNSNPIVINTRTDDRFAVKDSSKHSLVGTYGPLLVRYSNLGLV